jgi:hypothetical protein
MKEACGRGSPLLFAATLLLSYSATSEAQSNVAFNMPVIAQSGEWNNNDQFNASHITDGIVCEMDQNEGGPGVSSYWLGWQGLAALDGPGGRQTVIIDLQTPTLIDAIELRNTHNWRFNDRATMDFQIDAANDIQVCGQGVLSTTFLVEPVTILMGRLSLVDGINCPDEIPPDIFDSTNGLTTGGTAFRYLQFIAINAYPNKNNNVGLNELEVFGSQ